MPLTDVAIRNAKPRAKAFKLYDSAGLYLEVSPSGGKWWRLKYRFDGKERRISLGVYPAVKLTEARDRRDAERKILASGVDPSVNRQTEKTAQEIKAASSFEQVTREWFERFSSDWAPGHAARKIRLFERDLFPWIGELQVSEITAPEILSVLRRIEERNAADTQRRALVACSQVFRYAVATGRIKSDPTRDLRGALPKFAGEHFTAITQPDQLGNVLRAFEGYDGTLPVRCALRLMPLVFVRPGELRHAEWAHIDLDAGEWRYTATKTGTPHIVPLAWQAVAILRELHPLTGRGRLLFPSAKSSQRPMSDNAILSAMRVMGIPKETTTGHGFRATARTLLDEVLHFPPDIIEHQLAHNVRDALGRAYNRTVKLEERREMMQRWADYLDSLKAAKILAFPQAQTA